MNAQKLLFAVFAAVTLVACSAETPPPPPPPSPVQAAPPPPPPPPPAAPSAAAITPEQADAVVADLEKEIEGDIKSEAK